MNREQAFRNCTKVFLATAVAVFSIAGVGGYQRSQVATVRAARVVSQAVQETITCSGRVEREGAGQADIAKSALAQWKTTSPEDTYYRSILERYAASSNLTGHSSSSADPDAPDALRVCLNISETQIAAIQVGQRAEVTGNGFPDTPCLGVVEKISGEATQQVSATGQDTIVEVFLRLIEPDQAIKPGFTANAKIVTSQSDRVLLAPWEAVKEDKDGKEYLFVLEDGQAQKRFLETGREYSNGVEVLNGLQEGEAIVLNPDNATDGARFRLQRGESE